MAKSARTIEVRTTAPLIQNKRGWVLGAQHLEHPVGISRTVPDETLSVKEIMQKFVRGMPQVAGGLVREGSWRDEKDIDIDDFDLEEIERMDIVERQELAEQLAIVNKEKLERIKKLQEAARKAKEEADAKDKEFKAWQEDAYKMAQKAAGKAPQKDPKKAPPKGGE